VKPGLTWRDVKHVLASSARRIDADRTPVRAAFDGVRLTLRHGWRTNAAGYAFHNWYGFGAVSLDAAVALAETHEPGSLGEFIESDWLGPEQVDAAIPDGSGAGVSDSFVVAGLPETADIEAVVLEIGVEHTDASDLGVSLTSPGGMASVLNAPFNAVLDDHPGLIEWRLLSNAFYGESPNGEWTVTVVDLAPGDSGTLGSWRLRFYYGEHP